MIEEKNGLYKKDYTLLKIYTKCCGFWWLKDTLYREFDDGMILYRKTRDHYKKVFGQNEFKIDVIWDKETHEFSEFLEKRKQ